VCNVHIYEHLYLDVCSLSDDLRSCTLPFLSFSEAIIH